MCRQRLTPRLQYFLVHLFRQIKVVEHGTTMIVERWGKFHRRLEPGLHFLIPFMDSARPFTWRYYQDGAVVNATSEAIDLREAVLEFRSQSIITRDNVEIDVHPLLVYKIFDPIRVSYEVYDLSHAVEKLVQTALRSIIGDMGLDDTLASREEINRLLQQRIANVCFNWGFELRKVELLEITPNNTIQKAMHEQIAAERTRRAAVITADGFRQRVKTEAEGDSQAAIATSKGKQMVSVLEAKGASSAQLEVAQAQAQVVEIISDALDGVDMEPSDYIIAYEYIETLVALATAAASRIIYFPLETDVGGATRSL